MCLNGACLWSASSSMRSIGPSPVSVNGACKILNTCEQKWVLDAKKEPRFFFLNKKVSHLFASTGVSLLVKFFVLQWTSKTPSLVWWSDVWNRFWVPVWECSARAGVSVALGRVWRRRCRAGLRTRCSPATRRSKSRPSTAASRTWNQETQ